MVLLAQISKDGSSRSLRVREPAAYLGYLTRQRSHLYAQYREKQLRNNTVRMNLALRPILLTSSYQQTTAMGSRPRWGTPFGRFREARV